MKKIFAVLLLTSICSFAAIAQKQDPNTSGFDFGAPADSTPTEAPPQDYQEGDQPKEAPVKPYVRITLYVDSITNLISYVGVVEQEETGSDSLYTRAKRWATKVFAGGASKNVFEVDKRNQKLVINGWLPAYAYGNKYTKRDIGRYEFKISIWLKEGRYKYQLSNFVHEGIKPNQGNAVRNYFEFYYTSVNNIKGNDLILRYADKDMNALVEDFKKHMKDPHIVDEEEW